MRSGPSTRPAYRKLQKAAWYIIREEECRVRQSLTVEEQSIGDYNPMVERLGKLLNTYIDGHVDFTPFVVANRPKVGSI